MPNPLVVVVSLPYGVDFSWGCARVQNLVRFRYSHSLPESCSTSRTTMNETRRISELDTTGTKQ